MPVQLNGNVRMRGDTGPGVAVTVVAEQRRLKLLSGSELVGDWTVSDIGISSLQDGFAIKAEGEEFVLRTDDDVALADEMGIAAVSPRLARKLAARHNPEAAPTPTEPAIVPSNMAAIGFAVAGALVVLGGTFLRSGEGGVGPGGFPYWIVFVAGGSLMIAVAFVMSIGGGLARALAIVVLLGLIVAFGVAIGDTGGNATELSAYGFIAGGLVVGIAVLFSGGLRQS